MKRSLILLLSGICFASQVMAEDIEVIFKKVNELRAAGKYSQALSELGWAEKELERLNMEKIQSYIPANIPGFTAEKLKSNSALGMMNIERVFNRSSDGVQIRVSLIGAGNNSAAAAGFGSLAALGQMAAAMGNNAIGQEAFRVEGNTATLAADNEARTADLSVSVEGIVVKMEMSGAADKEALRKVLNSMDIKGMMEYLKK